MTPNSTTVYVYFRSLRLQLHPDFFLSFANEIMHIYIFIYVYFGATLKFYNFYLLIFSFVQPLYCPPLLFNKMIFSRIKSNIIFNLINLEIYKLQ